jgi:high affinity sulfate transporter 1
MDSATLPKVARKRTIGPDLVAGLTAAAVVIPQAMAYATLAGLPVTVGLYTSLVPMLVYGLLGSSRVLSVSTTSTLAMLTSVELDLVDAGSSPARLLAATATLAALVGVLLILAGILKLGVVANFVSEPVLTGFKAGVGLAIVLAQAPVFLGLPSTKGTFLHKLLALAENLPHTSLTTFGVGIGVILALLVLKRLWPRSPSYLIALGASIVAFIALGLQARGVDPVGVVPRGLPRPVLPDLGLLFRLLPGAAGIALMSFTESIAVGRALSKDGDPPIQANRELLAIGLANLGGAFLGAMPAGGGTSQTTLVRNVGGRSQVTSLVTGLTAVLVMLLVAPVLRYLPQSALAAVVIVSAIGLFHPTEFARIRHVRTMEFRWALLACLSVPVFGTLKGIVLAVLVSLLALLLREAKPRISVLGRKPGTDVFRPRTPEHPEDETFPGLLLLRPENRIFFANVHRVREQILERIDELKPHVVALDLSGVPDVEYSALKALQDAEKRAADRGIQLWLIGLNPEVLEVVRRCGLADRLGREGMFFNCQAAVNQFERRNTPVPLVDRADLPRNRR